MIVMRVTHGVTSHWKKHWLDRRPPTGRAARTHIQLEAPPHRATHHNTHRITCHSCTVQPQGAAPQYNVCGSASGERAIGHCREPAHSSSPVQAPCCLSRKSSSE